MPAGQYRAEPCYTWRFASETPPDCAQLSRPTTRQVIEAAMQAPGLVPPSPTGLRAGREVGRVHPHIDADAARPGRCDSSCLTHDQHGAVTAGLRLQARHNLNAATDKVAGIGHMLMPSALRVLDAQLRGQMLNHQPRHRERVLEEHPGDYVEKARA